MHRFLMLLASLMGPIDGSKTSPFSWLLAAIRLSRAESSSTSESKFSFNRLHCLAWCMEYNVMMTKKRIQVKTAIVSAIACQSQTMASMLLNGAGCVLASRPRDASSGTPWCGWCGWCWWWFWWRMRIPSTSLLIGPQTVSRWISHGCRTISPTVALHRVQSTHCCSSWLKYCSPRSQKYDLPYAQVANSKNAHTLKAGEIPINDDFPPHVDRSIHNIIHLMSIKRAGASAGLLRSARALGAHFRVGGTLLAPW